MAPASADSGWMAVPPSEGDYAFPKAHRLGIIRHVSQELDYPTHEAERRR